MSRLEVIVTSEWFVVHQENAKYEEREEMAKFELLKWWFHLK